MLNWSRFYYCKTVKRLQLSVLQIGAGIVFQILTKINSIFKIKNNRVNENNFQKRTKQDAPLIYSINQVGQFL